MRWLAPRHRPAPPLLEAIELLDPATLEVVEIDTVERPHGPPPERPAAPQPIEVGYAPRERDHTGLAGVWEALGA